MEDHTEPLRGHTKPLRTHNTQNHCVTLMESSYVHPTPKPLCDTNGIQLCGPMLPQIFITRTFTANFLYNDRFHEFHYNEITYITFTYSTNLQSTKQKYITYNSFWHMRYSCHLYTSSDACQYARKHASMPGVEESLARIHKTYK